MLITKLYANNEQFHLLNDVEQYIRHAYDKYFQLSVSEPAAATAVIISPTSRESTKLTIPTTPTIVTSVLTRVEEEKKKTSDEKPLKIQDSRVRMLIKILINGNITRRLTPEQLFEEYNKLISKDSKEWKRIDKMNSNSILPLCKLFKDIFVIYERKSVVIISLQPLVCQEFSENHQCILRTIDNIFNIAAGKYINCDKGDGLSFDLLRKMYNERFHATLKPSSDSKLAYILSTYADENIKFIDKYQIRVRHYRLETYLAECTITNKNLLDRIYKLIKNAGPLPLQKIYYMYTRQ